MLTTCVSTTSAAKEYFSNLDIHEIHFNELSKDYISRDEEDIMEEEADDVIRSGAGLIEMAFSKNKVEERKKWLGRVEKDTFLNYSEAQANGINYSDFINRELVLFSQYDNIRSIPHLLDGFKPSQRKVLYACFKKKLKSEIKVAQLAGYIGEHSAYHHGDMSLNGTIIGMAQSYCGSNNVNLLYPSGQFGTRRMGGKDHASARYIFTRLEKIARELLLEMSTLAKRLASLICSLLHIASLNQGPSSTPTTIRCSTTSTTMGFPSSPSTTCP